MTFLQVSALHRSSDMLLPPDYRETHWYAVYTSANHEKRVRQQLEERRVESFLPVYDTIRRWKDRQKRMQLPLFPGYVFVHIALRDRLRVLQIPGVVKLVGASGTPTALAEGELETLRTSLASGVRAEPHPFLAIGRRVRIRMGPLAGLQGLLVQKKNKARFVVSLKLIMRSIAVEVDEADLQAV
jgi:transcription antitermination factor NusG